VALTVAVLDANVLVPVSLTDALLRSAEHRRYAPLWSEAILDEVVRHVARLHPARGIEAARRRVAFMSEAFPDALVQGWKDLVEEMTNDPKDRHVLAAAAAGDADVVVTNNLDDFPADACAPLGIRALSADAFLCDIWRDDPDLARTMIEEQAADLRGHDTESVLEVLTAHAPNFTTLVRAASPKE
jgi:predicted nucleic acid-binding protein